MTDAYHAICHEVVQHVGRVHMRLHSMPRHLVQQLEVHGFFNRKCNINMTTFRMGAWHVHNLANTELSSVHRGHWLLASKKMTTKNTAA